MIVVFDEIEETAACNWLSVETLMIVPDGGGSGGAGRAGAAVEDTASVRTPRVAAPTLLNARICTMIRLDSQRLCQADPVSALALQDFCAELPYNSRRC